MSVELKTVWVTARALERGIEEAVLVDKRPLKEITNALVCLHPLDSLDTMIPPGDWHTTREAAVSRANQMRDAKLTSLEKQVERLRGMWF